MSQTRGVQLLAALRELLANVDAPDAFSYGLMAASASPAFWRKVLAEWEAEEGVANLVARRQAEIDRLVARFQAVWETM